MVYCLTVFMTALIEKNRLLAGYKEITDKIAAILKQDN